MLQVFREVNHDQQHQKLNVNKKNTAPIAPIMSPLSIKCNYVGGRLQNHCISCIKIVYNFKVI